MDIERNGCDRNLYYEFLTDVINFFVENRGRIRLMIKSQGKLKQRQQRWRSGERV